MVIKVTQEHIEQAQFRSCASCPIALALKEAVPQAIAVHVTWTAAFSRVIADGRDTNGHLLFNAILPDVCAKFVRLFDSQQFVKPFQFIFDGAAHLESVGV